MHMLAALGLFSVCVRTQNTVRCYASELPAGVRTETPLHFRVSSELHLNALVQATGIICFFVRSREGT